MLVAQNRGNATDWLETVRRMQAEQGLWELPPEDETAIVAYLARHYPRAAAGPRRPPLAGHQYPRAAAGSRRPPLAAHLLPAVPSNSSGDAGADRSSS